jgi:arylsulfatase A-like enzyme
MILVALFGLACSGEEPPRLLLLLTSDTLRADRLGAYGNPYGLTPNLDGLIAESQVFEFAYATAGHTLPSLSALMTGRYPEKIGMRANVLRLPAQSQTLAAALNLYGWRTGAVVSNFVVRRASGLDQGFEEYDDEFPQEEMNRDTPERIASGTTDAALAMLDRLGTNPQAGIFIWVHYQDPHGPYTPPAGKHQLTLDSELEAPDATRELPVTSGFGIASIPRYQVLADHRTPAYYRAAYNGEVSFLDDQVGRLLAGIRERGLYDGAVIAFSADHGEGMGEDDYWFSHGEYLTDPVLRVPLALRVPNQPPTRRFDPASLVDLMPTLLHAVGLDLPTEGSGRDLLAPGAATSETPPIYMAGLHGSSVPRYGVVAEGHKYLVTIRRSGREESLHRLGDEGRDLKEQDPATLDRLRGELMRIRKTFRGAATAERQALDEEERERLRQLGYVVDD